MATLNSLSDETLLTIFIWNSKHHLKPLHDPSKTTLATSQVSRRFREIMLEHPILWTNSFDISRPLTLIKRILHPRMGDHPIERLVIPSITPFLMQNHRIRGEIEMYAYHEFPTINTLFNNEIKLKQFPNRLLHLIKLLPQARNLVLKIPYHGWLLLEMLFEFSVEHLESLSLMRDEVDMHAEYKTCTITTLSSVLRQARTTWEMRTLRFRGCCVELNSPAFKALENLYITQLPASIAFMSSNLVDVLKAMPMLKRVRLIDVLLTTLYPNSINATAGAFKHLPKPIALPYLVEFVLWGHISPVGEVAYSLDIPADCATSIYGKGVTSHRGPDPPVLLILHQLRVMFERQQPPPPALMTSKTKRKSNAKNASFSEAMNDHPEWWNTLVVQMRANTCRVRVWRQTNLLPLDANMTFVTSPVDVTSSSSSMPPVGLELCFAWDQAVSTPSLQPAPASTLKRSPTMPVEPSIISGSLSRTKPTALTHAHTYPGPIPVNHSNTGVNNHLKGTSNTKSPVVPSPRFGSSTSGVPAQIIHSSSPPILPTPPSSQPQPQSQLHTYPHSHSQSQQSYAPSSHPHSPSQPPSSRTPSLLHPPTSTQSSTTTPMQTRSPPLSQHIPPSMSGSATSATSSFSSQAAGPSSVLIPPRLELTALFQEVTRSLPKTCNGILALHLEYDHFTSAMMTGEGQVALDFLAKFPKVQVLDKISAKTAAFLVPYFAFPFDVSGGPNAGPGSRASGRFNGMDVDDEENYRERERDRERITDPLQSLHTICFTSVDFTQAYCSSWPALKAGFSGEGMDYDHDLPPSRQSSLMELRHILLEYVERRARNEELPLIRELVFRGCKGITEKEEATFLSLGTMMTISRS